MRIYEVEHRTPSGVWRTQGKFSSIGDIVENGVASGFYIRKRHLADLASGAKTLEPGERIEIADGLRVICYEEE